MLAEERRLNILGLIQENGSARTVELARIFRVSDQTIRRDLEELQGKGLISKHHGGGVMLPYKAISYRERSVLRHREKELIATAAARLVKPGMKLALGPGTTTEHLARKLSGRDVDIVTNSLAVAGAAIEEPTRVHLTGGRYRPAGELLVGQWSLAALADLFVDIAFIGVSGIGPDAGYSVTDHDEATVLRQFVRVAKTTVVVADSSKFQRVAEEGLAPLGAVHALVTDGGITAHDRQRLLAAGVEVLVAADEPGHQP